MLKGELVTLRAMQREDVKPLYDLQQDYMENWILGAGTWYPYPLASAEKHFDSKLEDEETHKFVVEADNKIIGNCGLHHISRMHSTTSFGISILPPEYLGKGYGRDAIKLLMYYTFRLQNFHRLWLETAAPNERAIRSYEACGFQIEARLRQHWYMAGQYVDGVQMYCLRGQWEALNFPPPASLAR